MAHPARPRPRFAAPPLGRSLLASGALHGGLIGAGVLLGVVFGFERAGRERHEYVARFELGPAEPFFEEPHEEVAVTEVAEEREPELRETLPWQEVEVPSEEPMEPTRLVHTEWVESLPFLTGETRREPMPSGAELPVEPVPEPPRERAPEPPRTPVVVAATLREAPRPAYPRLARRAGEEGSVLCRLHIDVQGRVERVEVVESSGFERLDEAARSGLLAWTFEPRREDGIPVAETRLHRVTFRLDGG